MGLLIGISGKRGAGKSLLGTVLTEHHGFQDFSFAGALKAHCRQAFGLTSEQTDGRLKEEPTGLVKTWVHLACGRSPGTYWTPRDIMIAVGNFYRGFDEDFWVKRVMSAAAAVPLAAITDVRYANEARHIVAAGGVVVRLDRSHELNVYKAILTDRSETELDGWPFNFRLGEDRNIDRNSLEVFAREILSDIRSRHVAP